MCAIGFWEADPKLRKRESIADFPISFIFGPVLPCLGGAK